MVAAAKLRAALDPARIRIDLARRSLREFVRYAWEIVEPTTPLIWGWYLDAICDHLEAVSRRDIRELVINMPPRHLKSTVASVLWPAWEWIERPETRWLTGSYALGLAIRDARRSRSVMSSPHYRTLLRPDPETGEIWSFATDQNVKGRYENDRTGWRITTSVDAGATGEGGDILVVDDPHNVQDVESEAQRLAVQRWWDETIFTRRNDPKRSARVMIMQRSHENDLTGHVIKRPRVQVLCLPLEYESFHPTPTRSSLDFKDPRTEDGELLCPERIGPAEVAEIKEQGAYLYAGQMQQRPTPRGGGIFKDTYFGKRWAIAPAEFDLLIQSWDLAFGDRNVAQFRKNSERSYVAGYTLGFKGTRCWALDEIHGRFGFSESCAMIARMTDRWPQCSAILIEAKANGEAAEDILHDLIPNLELVLPKGSKVARALAIESWAKAGGIIFPADNVAPWAKAAVEEMIAFPFGLADDRVDAISQGVVYGMRSVQRATGLEDRVRAMTAQG